MSSSQCEHHEYWRLERFLERLLRVHAIGINREAGVLARKSLALARIAQFGAHGVDQVGRIAAVEHA